MGGPGAGVVVHGSFPEALQIPKVLTSHKDKSGRGAHCRERTEELRGTGA